MKAELKRQVVKAVLEDHKEKVKKDVVRLMNEHNSNLQLAISMTQFTGMPVSVEGAPTFHIQKLCDEVYSKITVLFDDE